MRAGPKRDVDDSVLPFRPRSPAAALFALFCKLVRGLARRRKTTTS
jgi:hypothetical protein